MAFVDALRRQKRKLSCGGSATAVPARVSTGNGVGEDGPDRVGEHELDTAAVSLAPVRTSHQRLEKRSSYTLRAVSSHHAALLARASPRTHLAASAAHRVFRVRRSCGSF